MSPPGTFERVYVAIKDRLRAGAYKPGARLEPALLSDELNASVTPIRDALHRLTGERLVEAPRQEGFRVPLLSEARLRHLHAWHRDLLLLAIMRRSSATFPELSEIDDQPDPHARIRAAFALIARSQGNPEHLHALELAAERLEALERFEDMFLDGIETEANSICGAIRDGDERQLRKLLVNYHRRRERIVAEMLECLELD